MRALPRHRAPSGLMRHLEGWQAGVVAILVGWVGVLLFVPRDAPPEFLPLPRVDARALAAERAADRALAEGALASPVAPTVRLVGAQIRQLGTAEHTADRRAVQMGRRALEASVADALAVAPQDLARLRAYQCARFVEAFDAWLASGEESADLRELAGPLPALFRSQGWIREDEGVRTLALDRDALRVLCKRRFNELLERPVAGMALTPTEELVWLRAVMRTPPQLDTSPGARLDRQDLPPSGDAYVLGKITEVERLDPAYPGMLARGIVLMRMQRWEAATEAFSNHLDMHPDGAFRLRAVNHMALALHEAQALR